MQVRFKAEWEEQRMVQLTWPHADTDWGESEEMLRDAKENFTRIAREIAETEMVLVVTPESDNVLRELEAAGVNMRNIIAAEIPSNDTWARDHGGITVETPQGDVILDFCFNGWGMKFAADKDNMITSRLYEEGFFGQMQVANCRNIVLEGGSLETDGKGTLLTTSSCLLSKNRNDAYSKEEIEDVLRQLLGVEEILWLDYGGIEGDDTDGHIDTLARLTPDGAILYQDLHDEMMNEQLLSFGRKVVALPYIENDGLPRTYANYLVTNDKVLVPTYDLPTDGEALRIVAEAFPTRRIVGIDCRTLVKWHGSLHCVTMQY